MNPETWSRARLGDAIEARYGKSLPAAMRRDGRVPVYGSNGVVGSHNVALTRGAALVIGRKGSSGEVALSPVACWPIDTTYFIDDPGPFTFRFLEYLLLSLRLTGLDRSTAIPGLSRDQLYDLTVPVPPHEDQEEIVRTLSAVNRYRDAASRHLFHASELAKRFRHAVLVSAATGELTSDWRKRSAAQPWTLERAADVCRKVQSGTTPKSWHSSDGGVPFIKVYNIVDQKLDFDYRPQFISNALHTGAMGRACALPGDVLMNIVGPPLGKVAIVTDQYPEWSINQALTLFRPSTRITSEWLYVFLCSGLSVREVMPATRGTVGQDNISLSQCRDFRIPVPGIEEQHEIALRVRALQDTADSLEARLRTATALVNATSRRAREKLVLAGSDSGEWHR